MDSTQLKEKKKAVQRNPANSFGADFSNKGITTSIPRPVQRNSANSFGADFSSKGATRPMPKAVQRKMENSFGADFSNVLIHKDSGSATDMGAQAYAQGNEIHFAPGQYHPETRKGQELLGHELAHIVQQRQGRVQPTTQQGKGMAVNDDPVLEREADVMGTKAADGKSVIISGKVGQSIQKRNDSAQDDMIANTAQSGGQDFWFDDKQGKFFFDHWRDGNGKELYLNDAEWSAYMKNNDYLATVSIATHLNSLGIKNSVRISGSFHGNTGQSNWRSGHGMLNGSNARVGDLQYSGHAHVNSNGSVSFLLNFTWNDIMDPNSNHFGDRVGAALFPGTPYSVHISWTDLITITPK